jgi:hypothetical protein
MENRTSGKRQLSLCLLQTENENGELPFVCWKWKPKTEVCFLLGRQTINGDRQLLFQKTCLSMPPPPTTTVPLPKTLPCTAAFTWRWALQINIIKKKCKTSVSENKRNYIKERNS